MYQINQLRDFPVSCGLSLQQQQQQQQQKQKKEQAYKNPLFNTTSQSLHSPAMTAPAPLLADPEAWNATTHTSHHCIAVLLLVW